MENFYYIFEDNKSHGPYDESQIKKMLLNNEINPETLIMNSENESLGFQKVSNVINLNNNSQTQVSNEIDAKLSTTNNIEINTIHPWKRLFAVLIDALIIGTCTQTLNKILSTLLLQDTAPICFIIGLLYYPLLIGLYGTTLGKLIFGIKLIDSATKKSMGIVKSFFRYFLRLIALCWGLLIPLTLYIVKTAQGYKFSIIFLLSNFFIFIPYMQSYFYYKKHSKTIWDKKLNIDVIFKKDMWEI